MCVINVRTYVHPDGRRETVEEKRLCIRSDKVNPCYNHTRHVQPEVFLASGSSYPASPSLINDDLSTPLSGSFPSTPVSATAGPRVEFRQPLLDRTPSSREKGKKKVLDLGDITIQFGKKTKKYPAKKRIPDRSSRLYDDDDGEDDDDIVAIEEDGSVYPTTPTRRPGNGIPPPPPPPPMPMSIPPGLSSPFPAGRTRRPRAEVHQPNPPNPPYPSSSTHNQFPVPSSHRRTFTAPEPITMPQAHSDNEIWDRAAARERLRLEERERRRTEDAQKRLQEEADRRFAERLVVQQEIEKERQEQAADDFSTLEYGRIQEREELRRRAKEKREHDEMQKRIQDRREQEEVERIAHEIRKAKFRRDRDAARRAEERAAKLAAEQRRQYEETRRRETELQARLARIERKKEERRARETTEEIERLEREIEAARRERHAREARERRLVQEVHAAEQLQAQIRDLEAELGQMTIDSNEAEIRRREEQLRYLDPIDGPRFGERRNIVFSPSPPVSPHRSPAVDTLASRSPTASPYQDPEYRRLMGSQVLGREWARGAQAQAASQAMQRAFSDGQVSGVVRRYSTGGNRPRDTRYRDHFRRYPS